jgi:hypothetical protein
MEAKPMFAGRANQIKLENPTTYHLPDWDGYKDPKKLALMRQIVLQYGRDPRVAQLAVNICRQNGVKPREYRKQAACLLKWVQDNIYYVNEPGERLQSPFYTLKSGLGDCDDLAILLCSLFECVRLPWKLVITAPTRMGIQRYIEGDPNYRKLPYSHIYCCVGNRPFNPTSWEFCEPTMSVPLGWDIVKAQNDPQARQYLPELGSVDMGGIVGTGMTRGILNTDLVKKGIEILQKDIILAIVIGSITSAGTEIMLDYLRSSDLYQSLVLRKGKRSA